MAVPDALLLAVAKYLNYDALAKFCLLDKNTLTLLRRYYRQRDPLEATDEFNPRLWKRMQCLLHSTEVPKGLRFHTIYRYHHQLSDTQHLLSDVTHLTL